MNTKPNDEFTRAWDESIQAESGAGAGTTKQASEQRADSSPDSMKGQEGSTAADASAQKSASKPSGGSAGIDSSAAPSSSTQRADSKPGGDGLAKEPKSNATLAGEQRKDSEPTKMGQEGSTTADGNSQRADSTPKKVEKSTPASRGPGGSSTIKNVYADERAEYEAAYATMDDDKKA